MDRQKPTVAQKDPNFVFLTTLDQNEEEQRMKPIAKFNQQIKRIKQKLQSLEKDDQEEWSRILTAKCFSLRRADKKGQLKRTVRILVLVCNELRIAYDRKGIETLLKKLYFEQFGKQIVREFAVADFDIDDYEVLEYQDPWYSKLFSYFFP